MITTLFVTCFFSGKRVNVALNDSAGHGCLLEPGCCSSQSLPSLEAFQNTVQKHLKKSVKTYLDTLDHAAADSYLMPCARYNFQTGQTYLRLECRYEKQPVSMWVIIPMAYFVSFLKWAPISCLQSSHRVVSPQKRPVGLHVGCFTSQQAFRVVKKRREGRGSEGLPLHQKGGRESNSCGCFFAHRLISW